MAIEIKTTFRYLGRLVAESKNRCYDFYLKISSIRVNGILKKIFYEIITVSMALIFLLKSFGFLPVEPVNPKNVR